MKRFYLSKSIILTCILVGLSIGLFAQTSVFTFNGTASTGNAGINGTPQPYVVPPGVSLIGVDMYGAAGGWPCCNWSSAGSGGPRANGGRVQCTMNVTPGTTLWVYVGGQGGDNYDAIGQAPGGWNGGATGGQSGDAFAASGGGATDIRTSTTGAYATSVIAVAGAGGGGGDFGPVGGLGGGLTGGLGNAYSGSFVCPGQQACGGGQTGPACTTGLVLGTQGQGGVPNAYSCGGGGGGWWGGNSAPCGSSGDGSGGGGSSYPATPGGSITSIIHTQGYSLATSNGQCTITVLCNAPGTISGPSAVCLGATSTLSETATGGTWSSSNTSVATIGTNGVVTGVSLGTATITYTVGNPCGALATATLTVNPLASPITGSLNACIGQSTTLGSSPAGGTWSSSNTSVATVNSSGAVFGVASGTANISYALSTGCTGATATVTVNATPPVPSGSHTVCGSLTTTLTDGLSGGTWSSSNPAVASVGSGSGVVTGGSAGSALITYTSSFGCPNTFTMTVNALSAITGIPSVCLGATTILGDATPGGTWSSTNTSVATINSSGVVTSVALGSTTISYSVASSGCAASFVFNVTGTPNVYTVNGGGTYCAGGISAATVGLSGTDNGVSYQLYNGAVPVGAYITGAGFPISFGAEPAGTYNVKANPGSGCATNMTGSATVSTTPLPTAFSVTGGGNYCVGASGVDVGLSGSTIGVNYQLFVGAIPVGGPVFGTGAALDFGFKTTTGTYTVVATNASTGCVNTMGGSAIVGTNPLPAIQTVTVGGGGGYCIGGAGQPIGLSGSVLGTSYQLLLGGAPFGSPVAGTGGIISFGNQTTAGTYTVMATTAAGCQGLMSGSVTITINPLPTAFTVTGGGSYCVGNTTGVPIGLSGSTIGVNYQLYYTALGLPPVTVGAPLAGTGFALTFSGPATGGTFTNVGSYSVAATNGTTGCTNNMTGSVAVTTNPLPSSFTLTGGGGYCSGGAGVSITIGGSVVGTTYQLFDNGGLVGALSGTGAPLVFTPITSPGSYSVTAIVGATGCTAQMSNTLTVTINPLPLVQTVGGGGNYCSGASSGFPTITLASSQSGISYQLFNGVTPVGTAVTGTGSSLSFSFTSAPPAGSYTVVATNTSTGCTNVMSGSAAIGVNPLPVAYLVTGGGGYCSGSGGVHIGLSNSDAGISYALKLGAGTVTTQPGVFGILDFGLDTAAGTYTVIATNATTLCTANMSGSAVVTVNPRPNSSYILSPAGSSSYCSGGAGVVMNLSNSDVGFNYQLVNGGVPAGGPVAGTGSGISFPAQTAIGTYNVVATNATTLCNSTETGSVTVSINALPFPEITTGGGSYCSGGAGVVVGLGSSQVGVSYKLMLSGGAVGLPIIGSGSAINFPPATAAGAYTVMGTNSAGCSATMPGGAVITVNPLPTLYTITEPSGNSYCAGGAGVPVGLSGSNTGINYQLLLGGVPAGSPVAGTGTLISFGLQTAAGSYTVLATNSATGCQNTMTGAAPITINPLPTTHNITSTGSSNYCPGGTGVVLGLDGSNMGISYQLYHGATTVGAPLPGTNAALSFGPQTALGAYTVQAINIGTSCADTMAGTINVGLYPLPVAYTVTGGGSHCPGSAGVPVGLSNSSLGVSYQLYNGVNPAGLPVPGTGFAISFGLQTTAGTYTVVAMNNVSGCTNNMTGSVNVSVYMLPNSYSVVGGGTYCAGGTGVAIGIDGSDVGISYQLYQGLTPVGSAIAGTGLSITFGMQTVAGPYTVVATSATTTCSSNMSGSVVVTISSLPASYAVTGGGNYCSGGAGVPVGLATSTVGVNYQLMNGVTLVGSPVAGTGGAISFGAQTGAGTYTVVGTVGSGSGCSNNMYGSAVVVINPLPVAYTVTGGGHYCSGTTGADVMLSNSNLGINYQLLVDGGPVGMPKAGTGSALDFGPQTAPGTYTVQAVNGSTGCTNTMSASVDVTVDSLPNNYTVIGTSTNYCAGGLGVDINLSGSDAGISYQVYLGTTAMSVPSVGTGFLLDLGYETAAGFYTAVAINPITGCMRHMSGGANVTINPLPNAYAVTGGGSYCSGGSGVSIGLGNSNVGISYQLMNGVAAVGAPVVGTGSAISFGPHTAAGVYTVLATNTATGCNNYMTGSAAVIVNPLPTAFSVTGGGNYCFGGAGVAVDLSGSESGVNYQAYNGITATGTAVSGTGSALTFGPETGAGTYTVMGTDATTGCMQIMTGSANVLVNSLPASHTVIGGGNYCPGGTGVSVGLSGSNGGVNYQLYNGTATVGLAVSGSGGAINFGLQTTTGTYSVVATNTTTGCTTTMGGTVNVGLNSAPNVYSVIGGGNYCSGGAGVHVGLNNSTTGVNYQLLLGGLATGSPVSGLTSSPVDFGLQMTPGTYTVVATNASTGCTSSMAGFATVTVNPLVAPSVTLSTGEGDTVCSGHLVAVTALAANGGMTPAYQWTVDGVLQTATGSVLNYYPADGDVVAVTMTSSALCATPASVSSSLSLSVMENGTPTVTVTASPGDSVCTGTTVNFTTTTTFGGTPTISWVVNGTTVLNADSYSYIPANNDNIYVEMTSTYRCRTATTVPSSHITMTVMTAAPPTVAIAADPVGANIASGQTLTLTAVVSNGGPNPTYQWLINGTPVPGANLSTFVNNNYNNLDSVTCQVTSDGICAGTQGSASVVVHVSAEGVTLVNSTIGDVQLVPNPNKGNFILKGSLGATADEEVSIEVTNMLGQTVYANKVMSYGGNMNEHIQLNGNVANGMYLLNLHTVSGNKVFHLVVEQ